jgi:hypothetical protein
MASSSPQTVSVPEPKPAETASPRPIERPADKPFTIKVHGQIPS